MWRAAAITSSVVMLSRPGSGSFVCESEVRLPDARNTILRVAYGPLRAGSVGPKIATTGTCSAAARCKGPVSPPINSRTRRVSAMSSPGMGWRAFHLPRKRRREEYAADPAELIVSNRISSVGAQP